MLILKGLIFLFFAYTDAMQNNVILVDGKDRILGTEEKLKAHQDGGQLHRAFSLFVFNAKGAMLIQKRAEGKYHCPGLWTNACCSHPGLEMSLEDSARKRLQEELGMGCADMSRLYSFIYRETFDNGLTEHELDHVLVTTSDEEPVLNPEEASEVRWLAWKDLQKDLINNPESYTYWFKLICEDKRFLEFVEQN